MGFIRDCNITEILHKRNREVTKRGSCNGKTKRKKAVKKSSFASKITDLESYLKSQPLAKKKVERLNSPVSIHIHSKRKRLTDADGISAKAAIDGLVLTGILEDDNNEWVKSVTYSQEKV